jgi:sucrose-6-phosphate hydrolase SacC (GH32 family)
MNDPVGLFVHAGRWHLHYQRATDPEYRAMGWGAASSSDLLRWDPEPDALLPDDKGWIYSGSVVTGTGLDDESFAAFYTRHDPAAGRQRQELALSRDGREWRTYVGNPLIDEGRGETRDPFVFSFGGEWRMLVAEPVAWREPFEGRSQFALYRSLDLLAWERIGDLGVEGPAGVMFETPVLRRLPVEGEAERDWPWILLAGLVDRNDDGARCSTQAWIGRFDGSCFEPEAAPFALDHGPDFYAPSAWAGIDDLVVTGWVNSWAYARQLPGDGWIGGAHALPRRLSARRSPDGALQFHQRPVVLPAGRPLGRSGSFAGVHGVRIEAGLDFAVRLDAGTANEASLVGSREGIRLARAGGPDGFGGEWNAPSPDAGPVTLLVDGCVLTLFAGDAIAMTALVIRQADLRIELSGDIQRAETLAD